MISVLKPIQKLSGPFYDYPKPKECNAFEWCCFAIFIEEFDMFVFVFKAAQCVCANREKKVRIKMSQALKWHTGYHIAIRFSLKCIPIKPICFVWNICMAK